MLVPVPIGLWIFSLAADVVARVGGDPVWLTMAYWTMLAGTIGALVAAVPGLIDYAGVTAPRAVRIATLHLALNLTLVGLYVANLVIRTMGGGAGTLPLVLSVIGVGLLVVSGWYGGELVYRQGVAVEPEIRVRRTTQKGAA
jgi:uncharacterized membrane protein